MRPVRRAGNLATFTCRLSRNSGSLKLLKRSGPVTNTSESLIMYIYSLSTLYVAQNLSGVFVVDKVALGEVFLPLLRFSSVTIITPLPPYINFCQITYVIVMVKSVVK